MNDSMPLVEARHVTKRFGGVTALNDASVQFFPGEVHCLAGENGCGKSTLIKVISGAHRPTSGDLVIEGRAYDHLTPKHAFELGLDVIYQDFSLMPNLTAAENIALPNLVAAGRKAYRKRHVREIAEQALDRLGVPLELDTPVGELSVAERQLCAVARALAHEAKFIAMDEPTTALTWREVEFLFAAVRGLRADGVSVVFISHKMQEVFSISDRVTVMRNGTVVATGSPADFTHASLAETMMGRSTSALERPHSAVVDDPPALTVRGLGRDPLFADVSFSVGQGEIVGLAGLLGSGRTEIAEAIAGVKPATHGTLSVLGQEVTIRSLPDAIEAGVGYVPEDRLTQGLFLNQPIADNIAVTHIEDYTRGPLNLLDLRQIRAHVNQAIRDLRIKVASVADPVRSLSGGNAQRVLLSKWLVGRPKVLILNGPTVGVDVGSKFDILAVLNAQSLGGLGVLIISDDVPELISMCHRVLVVRSGRLEGELSGKTLTEQLLVEAITA